MNLNDKIALTVANEYGFNRRSVIIDRGTVYAGSEYCGTIDERRNELRLDRTGREPMTFGLDRINPVVKRTALRAYAGWTVREYADSMFDCSGPGIALSPGYETFAEAVGFAKRDGASA
jgi:hypothetical protein